MDSTPPDYAAFLAAKRISAAPVGFEPDAAAFPDGLFPWQRDIVTWALRRGRAALFEDCGLGKTLQQLVWADQVVRHAGHPVLILAPLAVARQTADEAAKFGLRASVVRDGAQVGEPGIYITNYDLLHRFEPAPFAGVVLDESSILKDYSGKTRTAIIEAFQRTPYRLAATATPAPNDHMELGNHAEFLSVMTRTEMLATFFVHDGGETQSWRLKGHAEHDFWAWVASWAVMLRRPSDLGYPDEGFALPPIHRHQITVNVEHQDGAAEGAQLYLFNVEARTLQERRNAKKVSLTDRVNAAATLVNGEPDEPWVVWCNLNDESKALAAAIDGAVEVTGSDPPEVKEQLMLDFAAGKIRVLVSKPSICGWGMNWQHAARMAFVGLSDSYEQVYQAEHREWRYGQTRPVHVYVITSELEGAVVRNIERKQQDADRMAAGMLKHMAGITSAAVRGTQRDAMTYKTTITTGDGWTAHLGDTVEMRAQLADNSIDYEVFSPPFASLYTYTNSDRDMGNCRDDAEFMEHYRFLVREQFRTLKPGRLLSFHCMNLPTTKARDGYIGIRDFRGDLIREYLGEDAAEMHRAILSFRERARRALEDGDTNRGIKLHGAADVLLEDLQSHPGESGFIFHSEVCIWKDPVTAMQRTKAIGLLYKQLKKDSALSRQGIPDYLVTMRKPGDNPTPITKDADAFPVELWQRYASPVWMDINPSNTLQYMSVREHNDERHICPLQLDVIERAVTLWSNPGDLVCSPFMGIGSEGYVALKLGRRFVGAELKESYYRQATKNLEAAAIHRDAPTLFDLEPAPFPEAA